MLRLILVCGQNGMHHHKIYLKFIDIFSICILELNVSSDTQFIVESFHSLSESQIYLLSPIGFQVKVEEDP